MKKNISKEAIIVLILLHIILLCLIGFVFLQQNFKKQTKQILELKNEIKTLEEKKMQMVYEREELQMTGGGSDGNQGSGQDADASSEGAAGQEGQASAGIEAVRAGIMANVSGRMDAGENWQVYVCRLQDHAAETVGSGRMTAASLIKLYIMGAVYENYDPLTAQNGKETVDGLLRSMITVSDNDAANTLTKMLGQGDAAAGRSAVNDYCVRNGYTDSSMERMLLETGTDRENYTSAKDCGTFLMNIYQGAVPHGEDMMNLLKQQERRGKIPAGVPEGTVVANKTGELDHVENDAAIVFRDGCPYILCVMSEKLTNPSAARQTIVNVSMEVYNHIPEGLA